MAVPVDPEKVNLELISSQRLVDELIRRFSVAAFVGMASTDRRGGTVHPFVRHSEPSLGLSAATNMLNTWISNHMVSEFVEYMRAAQDAHSEDTP